MEPENIQSIINAIDNELKELKAQKHRLKNEIEEAEQALASAQKVRKEFDSFVSGKRSAKDKSIKPNFLKSFTSIVNKATEMLSGNEYLQVSNKVNELSAVAKNKIKKYNDDLNYCDSEIRKLQKQKENLLFDYKTLLAKQNESEEV